MDTLPDDVTASALQLGEVGWVRDLLMTLHGFSDSETTDALTFDLRWKAAVGWPVMAKAFHDTTLT